MPPNLTLHAFAAASDAYVMLGRRSVSGGVSCNGRWLMEPKSQGSLLNITLTHGGEAQGGGGNLGKGGGGGGGGGVTKGEERGEGWSTSGGGKVGGRGGRSRIVVTVFGSPWLIENCDVVLGSGRGRGGGGGGGCQGGVSVCVCGEGRIAYPEAMQSTRGGGGRGGGGGGLG